MKKKSLMTKAQFMTRRKVILYMVLTILTLGVVSGFTNQFITDNRLLSAAYGETIIMEAQPPETGSPEDYDLISNIRFAAYKLHHSAYFRGESSGKSVADIGYTQNIRGTRVANNENNIVFFETVSTSSLVESIDQMYADNGIIIYREGSTSGFSNSAYNLKYETYSKRYGSIPNQLCKYIIGTEKENALNPERGATDYNTILSAVDVNAKGSVPSEPNAIALDEGLSCYVPETVVADDKGLYTFRLSLDPLKSTLYYRNEVRTRADAEQNPAFKSVSVTITIDRNWTPVSVRINDEYDIAIPVIGAMGISGEVTEVFTMFDEPNGVIPEREFFQPYVDRVLDDPDYVPPEPPVKVDNSAVGYLTAAFGKYLSGEEELKLTADITSEYISAYDVTLSLGLGEDLSVKAMLGDMFIGYSGDRVNIKVNDLNGYLPVSALSSLMSNKDIAALTKGLTDKFADENGINTDKLLEALFGGKMLDKIFAKCEMKSENGVMCLYFPFELDLPAISDKLSKVTVEPSIYIIEEGRVLQKIIGSVKIGNTEISITAKPLKSSPFFPDTAGAKDLSPLADFVPDILATAKQKVFGINGNLSVNGFNIGVDAYVDIRDGVKADATLTVAGAEIGVTYINGEIELALGNIAVKGKAQEFIELVKPFLGSADKLLAQLKKLLPSTVNDAVGMLDSLEVNGDSLALKLKLLAYPVELTLSRADGKLSGLGFAADINIPGTEIEASGELTFTYPQPREITGSDVEPITAEQLGKLISSLEPLLDASAYEITAEGSLKLGSATYPVDGGFVLDRLEGGDVALSGALNAFGQTVSVTYADGTAYLGLKNILLKLNGAAADKLTAPIEPVVKAFAGKLDIAKLLKYISSLECDKNGILTVVLLIDGAELTVTVDGANGVAKLTYGETAFDLTVKPAEEAHAIAAPENAADYAELTELDGIVEKLTDILMLGGLTANVDISIGDVTYNAALTLSIGDDIRAEITENTLPLKAVLVGKDVFITLGDIKLTCNIDDIPAAIEALGDVLPAEVSQAVTALTAAAADIAKTAGTALDSVKSLTVAGGALTVNIETNDFAAKAVIASDLSKVTVEAGGATVELSGIAAGIDGAIASPDAAEYAALTDMVSVVKDVLPLSGAPYLNITLGSGLFGAEIGGNVYLDLSQGFAGIALQANLNIGDLSLEVKVVEGMLYLSVGGDVRLTNELSIQSLLDLLDLIDTFKPGIKDKVIAVYKKLVALEPMQLIGAASLGGKTDGFRLGLDLDKAGVDASLTLGATTDGNGLAGIDLSLDILGITADFSFAARDKDGAILALTANKAVIAGQALDCLDLDIAAAEARTVTPSVGASIKSVSAYIDPIMSLVNKASAAKSVVLDLDARIDTDSAYTNAKCTVALSLDPIAVDVTLTLFDGTDHPSNVNIKYTSSCVYITAGNIALSFDIKTDPERIYNVVKGYLPDYISAEIAKLLKIEGAAGPSAFSNISLLIERITAITEAKGFEQAFRLLFSPFDNGLSGDTAIRTLSDMVALSEVDGKPVVTATVMNISLNITPALQYAEDGAATLSTLAVTTELFGASVKAEVVSYDISSEPLTVAPPENAADYVSIASFIEAVNNGVNTFTERHVFEDRAELYKKFTDAEGAPLYNGDITFELEQFAFDYDVFELVQKRDEAGDPIVDSETGEPVYEKDAEGRIKPATDANGNKIVKEKIEINGKAGVSALKGVIFCDLYRAADGSVKKDYRFNLEAHVTVKMPVTLPQSSPLTLDLYIVNDDPASGGKVFLDYLEGNGNGERIELDYRSVMQIVAAVADILGVDDTLMNELFAEYRLDIDKTVFTSMDIAGLDKLQDLLNKAVEAIDITLKSALPDLKNALALFTDAGSIPALREELPQIRALIESAADALTRAIKLFAGEAQTPPTEEPSKPAEKSAVNGKLFGDIIGGITLSQTGGTVKASIENSVTTHTPGTSTVTVTQNASSVDSIKVDGLDVNTNRLNNFYAKFNSGNAVSVALPNGHNTTVGNSTYSDMGNIKHLLFDIMNTANMLEFEIGGGQNDSIAMSLFLGKWEIKDIPIKYSIKVKIIDQGEGAEPRYKTAADVQLDIPKTSVVAQLLIPECTTRVLFYDNVIYARGLVWEQTAFGTGVKSSHYVNMMFTVDDFIGMMTKDISKFFKEFVFRVLPLRETLIVNVHDKIIDAVLHPEAAPDSLKTVAQIFKGYTYDGSKHTAVIGLKELALNAALRDVTLSLTGANDGDDNILDNYISGMTVDTSFTDFVTLKLNATLTNARTPAVYYTDSGFTSPAAAGVQTEFVRNELESSGLGKTSIEGKQYSIEELIAGVMATPTLDANGKITALANNPNSVYQWERYWQ